MLLFSCNALYRGRFEMSAGVPPLGGKDRLKPGLQQPAAAYRAENIEARPLWKPMHLQPVFRGRRFAARREARDARREDDTRAASVSGRLFEVGLCLPSGSNLTDQDRERIVGVIRREGRGARKKEVVSS